MNQFRSVFSCTRIPEENVDRIVRHFKTASEGRGQKHIVVLSNGHVYSMNVLSDDDIPLTPPQMQKQLAWIEEHSIREQGPMVSALTATNRDAWAQSRQHMINLSATNAEFLEIIETSLFSVTFSDLCPETHEETALYALTGDARNQWFDKSLTQMCFENGMFSDSLDHSPADAMVAIVLFDFVTKQLEIRNFEWASKDLTEVEGPEEPRHLNFLLDQEVVDAIDHSLKEYDKLTSTLDLCIHVSDIYSKQKAKQFPRVHIDSFLQLAIQLTYYRLHQKIAPTYETGMTRRFYHGRTDTVRSCTTESTTFVKAMCESTSREDRSRLLVEAGKAHMKLMRDAQSGKGCDRHLFGLQMLAMEEGVQIPELFTSKGWKASGGGGNFVISTSFVGDSPVYGGFSPMVKDGYGVCYAITSNQLKFIVTSWKTCSSTSAAAFRDGLLKSIEDFKLLLAEH
jgi:carnitine O-octanoyltransferase